MMAMTQNFSKRFLALAAVAGVGLSLAPFTAATASAATVTKTITSKCQTNGAPAGQDETFEGDPDKMTITVPDQVKVGDEFKMLIDYVPAPIKGVDHGATVKDYTNATYRFTLDDPSSFVTAKYVGAGHVLKGQPTISLVGGNRLVLSNINVDVQGKDIQRWGPPQVEVTFKATKPGKIPTLHAANEGAAGQFNNAENFFTVKNSVSLPVIGNIDLQVRCQSTMSKDTLMFVNAVGSASDAKAGDTKANDNKAGDNKAADNKKADDKKADEKSSATNGDESASANRSASNDGGLQITDTDVAAEQDTGGSGTPGWLIALIVIIVLAIVGGGGYGIYKAVEKKKNNPNA